ncbi:GAF domain-containing protein [Actinosynnema sp. NPDC023794]
MSCRRRTAFSWRSTSSSASLAASLRSTIDGTDSRCRVTLYSRDTITRTCSQDGEALALPAAMTFRAAHPSGTTALCSRQSCSWRSTLRTMRAGQPWIVADAAHDARLTDGDRGTYQRTGIRAVVSVPLLRDGRFVAGVAVHQASVRHLTPAEVELISVVVGRCWESLQRVHADRVLRESEQRHRLLVEQATDAIWILDRDARFVEANRAACALLGRTQRACEYGPIGRWAGDEAGPGSRECALLRTRPCCPPVVVIRPEAPQARLVDRRRGRHRDPQPRGPLALVPVEQRNRGRVGQHGEAPGRGIGSWSTAVLPGSLAHRAPHCSASAVTCNVTMKEAQWSDREPMRGFVQACQARTVCAVAGHHWKGVGGPGARNALWGWARHVGCAHFGRVR